ncbi:hypothetical protein [Mycobacterium phage Maco6]|nr:hypothetical protein [Mycobacterium phage Maco7]UNY41904.1 hypothetical protein [Mycobacterium phage Maco6]
MDDMMESQRLQELEDTELLLYALHELASSSNDAESVRVAFAALTSTSLGLNYLKGHPITL